MIRIVKQALVRIGCVALLAVSASSLAHAASEAELLERGAVADVTAKQKYQTAIREAGGAYKEWLRDCAQLGREEQKSCRLEAKAVYDRDMAEARLILQGR